ASAINNILDVRSRRLGRNLGEHTWATRSLNTAVQRPTLIDLLYGQLGAVPLIKAKDRKIAGTIFEKPKLDRPTCGSMSLDVRETANGDRRAGDGCGLDEISP